MTDTDVRGFPSTPKTWIDGELSRGQDGRNAVWRHVMAVYAQPLEVFCRAMFRHVDDPADLVNGFIAHRVGDAEYFASWRTSGRRLRDWLRTGIEIHVRERSKASERRKTLPIEDSLESPRTEDPSLSFDREMVFSILTEARRRAEADCRVAGLDDHWEVFVRHTFEKTPYAEIVATLGTTEMRAVRMNDTAKKRFADTIRDIIRRDGVPESQIDQAIRDLIGVLKR